MDIIEKPVRRIDVPIAQKANLTLHEAAAYFNIGEKKLRQLTEGDRCPFVLYCGSKRLIITPAIIHPQTTADPVLPE